jgi:hypothetical protein
VKQELPDSLAISPLVIYPKALKTSTHKILDTILKGADSSNVLMSVDEWVDKCGADIEQHAIQLKKERSTDTCYKVDNPPKHYAM